jgi:hypothetical protein
MSTKRGGTARYGGDRVPNWPLFYEMNLFHYAGLTAVFSLLQQKYHIGVLSEASAISNTGGKIRI